MKYIPAEKLIAEIERRKADAKLYDMSGGDAPIYDELLSLITSLQQDKEVLDLCSQVWWEDRGWMMIPPNVTLKGIESLLMQLRKKLQAESSDFDDVDPKHLVHTHQEQPEPTCKSCGFYENNCPFIRNTFKPYPNKVCKDYTYSVMKEQEPPSLPSNLDEAAVQAHIRMEESGEEMTFLNTFKAGAEWMAGQGVTFETEVYESYTGKPFIEEITESFIPGDEVVVQIRKK